MAPGGYRWKVKPISHCFSLKTQFKPLCLKDRLHGAALESEQIYGVPFAVAKVPLPCASSGFSPFFFFFFLVLCISFFFFSSFGWRRRDEEEICWWVEERKDIWWGDWEETGGWGKKKEEKKKSVEWDTCLIMYKNKNYKCVMTQQIITTFFKTVEISNIHMSKRKF